MFHILSFPHELDWLKIMYVLFYKTVLHHSFCSFIIQITAFTDFMVEFMTCIHFPPLLIRYLSKVPVSQKDSVQVGLCAKAEDLRRIIIDDRTCPLICLCLGEGCCEYHEVKGISSSPKNFAINIFGSIKEVVYKTHSDSLTCSINHLSVYDVYTPFMFLTTSLQI